MTHNKAMDDEVDVVMNEMKEADAEDACEHLH